MELKMRYVALVDGRPGAYGVVFPDCPGCTAMSETVEEALINAIEALADWAEDADPMPAPRSIAKLRKDPEVKAALAAGDALALVPLVRDAWRAVKANISLDAGLLEAIDEAAEARGPDPLSSRVPHATRFVRRAERHDTEGGHLPRRIHARRKLQGLRSFVYRARGV